jgi:hypothetical protein
VDGRDAWAHSDDIVDNMPNTSMLKPNTNKQCTNVGVQGDAKLLHIGLANAARNCRGWDGTSEDHSKP